jgi:hypothetical protein
MHREAWKRALKVLCLVIAGTLVGWWFLHPRPSDMDLVEELVAKAEHGVETKSATEIMECVGPDYQDEEGLSRNDIFRLAWRWARSSTRADVVIEDYQIDIASPKASGDFLVQVLLEEQGQRLPALHFDLEVEFEKQRRGWRKVWLVTAVNGHGLENRAEDIF